MWNNLEDHCQSRTLSQNLLNLIFMYLIICFFFFSLNIFFILFFLIVQNFFLTHIVSKFLLLLCHHSVSVKIKFLEYWFLTIIIIEIFSFVSILKAYRYQIKISFFSILSYILPKYGIIFSLIAHPTHESLLLKTNGYCLLN